MKLLYALHEIRSGLTVIEPRTVDAFSEDEAKTLLAVGAVREPSEAEMALYRLGHPEAESAPVTEKKAGKASKAPAATATEPAKVDESQDL